MNDAEEEYSKNETMKMDKTKKGDDATEDFESLKKLEPMHKGTNSIKAFLNKKIKTAGKK